MKVEEYTKKIPEDGVVYGYTLRDYRKSGGGLRWSWAIEYQSGSDLITDYSYASTKTGAKVAARCALLVAAFKIGMKQS